MSDRRNGRGERVVRQRVDTGVAELIGDRDRPGGWTLLVDGTPQSHVDLDDPQYLEFEYMRRLGHLIDLAAPAGEALRVLHLGAGGLTLARYVAATRPGSGQLAAELDAALVEMVRRQLPLRQRGQRATGTRPGRLRVRAGDARAVLERVPGGSFDVVVADLFAGARTPAHLTSAEFAAAVARALSPSGLYAVNIGDGPPLAYARAQVATVRSVFPGACLFADAAVLRGRRFGNLVLAAAHRGLPVAGLARRTAADPFPGRLVHGHDLDRFTAGVRPVTDAQAESSPTPPPRLFASRRKPGQLALCRSGPGQNISRAEAGTPQGRQRRSGQEVIAVVVLPVSPGRRGLAEAGDQPAGVDQRGVAVAEVRQRLRVQAGPQAGDLAEYLAEEQAGCRPPIGLQLRQQVQDRPFQRVPRPAAGRRAGGWPARPPPP